MKRTVKRKTKAIFFFIILLILFLVASYFSIRFFSLFNRAKFSQDQKIISPKTEGFEIEKIKNKLKEINIKIDSFEISSKTAVLTLKIENGPIVLFSDSKNISDQLSSLQLIMRRLTIERGSLKPSKIDLRFRNPIVSF